MLYIALGDGGGADHRDGQNLIDDLMIEHGANGNGQNPDNPLSSLLRIDPLGDNSSNRSMAYRLTILLWVRIPYCQKLMPAGFETRSDFFDSLTGALVLADIGQNDIEEVNLVQPGGNYG